MSTLRRLGGRLTRQRPGHVLLHRNLARHAAPRRRIAISGARLVGSPRLPDRALFSTSAARSGPDKPRDQSVAAEGKGEGAVGSEQAAQEEREAEEGHQQSPFDKGDRVNIPPLPGHEFVRPESDAAKRAAIEKILRVDHAGEYGAVRIYDGQLAVLKHTDPAAAALVEEMREQEVDHLRQLGNLLPRRRVRPTALLPLWDVAGFALGAGTALLGTRAAMACTVAVEESITDHYNDQLRTLNEHPFDTPAERERQRDLRQLIRQNRDDEDEHKDIGVENEAEQAPFYSAISAVIKTGCAAAIWVSKRV